jgi:catechol 2,3-dioxygenase-like lactoylglutathione lyase family enzyme
MTTAADPSELKPTGAAPDRWAALVPELACAQPDASLAFYRDVLGFTVLYRRPAAGFAYLAFGEAQLMLEDARGAWSTAPAERPFGRGINLQIECADVEALAARIAAAGQPLWRGTRESWYRAGDREYGARELLIQDPDGYLLRFSQRIGVRPADARPPAGG